MLFLYRPESPLTENIRFLTQILMHKDGSEQRVCLRTGPRSEYGNRVIIEDGKDRAIIENALYGNQQGPWTIPAWPEQTTLSSTAAAGASTIACDHSLSDFRAGSQAIIYQDEYTYEVLSAITLSGGSIGFATPLANTWSAGTEVYPLRDALLGKVNSQRYSQTNVTVYNIQFSCLDASVNLFTGVLPAGSSLSFGTMGFGPDASALVLADPNAANGTLSEDSDAKLTIIDSSTGAFSNFTTWLSSRRSSRKGFVCHTRQDLWAIRVLLHALKGQQQAFFLPTFAQDFIPNAGTTSGTNTLTVVNTGWTSYAQGKSRKYVRVELVNGTHMDNLITGAAINSAVQETITFQNNWPATVSLGNIKRVSVYEKVRLVSDDVALVHQSLNGECTTQLPVLSVIE